MATAKQSKEVADGRNVDAEIEQLVMDANAPVKIMNPEDGLIPGDLYCVICGEDIVEDDELPEKTVDTKDGKKAHLDCYLRLKRFPTEFIDQVMAGKIAVRQTEPGGPVVVIQNLLPEDR